MGMELHGMSELLNHVRSLGMRVERNVEKKALEAGGEILVRAVKAEANRVRDDGTLHDNIKETEVKNGKLTVHTGQAYHAHLVEFGRSAGQGTYKDKNGVRRPVKWGDTSPNPVMARAFEKSKPEIILEMSKVIKREMGL